MKRIVLATSAILLMGCSSTYQTVDKTNIAVESVGAMTKREMSQKYLHTHSLMQSMMQLGMNERIVTAFRTGSDDMFVTNAYPESWMAGIMSAQNVPGVEVSGDILGGKTRRVLDIQDNRLTPYDLAKKHYVYPNILQGERFSDKYIINTDSYVQSIIEQANFSGEKISIERFLNKIYSIARIEGRDIYYHLDFKSNVITISKTPTYSEMTPFKRQFFVNFLNTRGINYITDGNRIAVKDNFTNWVAAMDRLQELQKYRHAVYAVHDGVNFFEVADGSYQAAPITIEMIDWTPNGLREYNIYSDGHNRKIDTDQRFYDFYLPDGSKKYTIRFY